MKDVDGQTSTLSRHTNTSIRCRCCTIYLPRPYPRMVVSIKAFTFSAASIDRGWISVHEGL